MTLASGLDAGASPGLHALARYRSEFPIFRETVYLNTCSLGALGERARRRIAQFVDVWQARGAAAWYDVWWAALGELRARYARIVGASPEEIALAPSISVALSAVAEALDYRRRPRVVVTSLDFPTVAYQWLAKRARGVELVVVESPDQVSVPVEAIARAVDGRTALVATSHVYFTSGACAGRVVPDRRVSVGRAGAVRRAGGGCRLPHRRRAQVAAGRPGNRVSVRAGRAGPTPGAGNRWMVRSQASVRVRATRARAA